MKKARQLDSQYGKGKLGMHSRFPQGSLTGWGRDPREGQSLRSCQSSHILPAAAVNHFSLVHLGWPSCPSAMSDIAAVQGEASSNGVSNILAVEAWQFQCERQYTFDGTSVRYSAGII